jgi:hypothetical protein
MLMAGQLKPQLPRSMVWWKTARSPKRVTSMTNECRADSVYCDSCGTRFAVKDLQDDQYIALQEQHRCPQREAELSMLLRVKDYYTRHAVAEGRTQLTAIASLQLADPESAESAVVPKNANSGEPDGWNGLERWADFAHTAA